MPKQIKGNKRKATGEIPIFKQDAAISEFLSKKSQRDSLLRSVENADLETEKSKKSKASDQLQTSKETKHRKEEEEKFCQETVVEYLPKKTQRDSLMSEDSGFGDKKKKKSTAYNPKITEGNKQKNERIDNGGSIDKKKKKKKHVSTAVKSTDNKPQDTKISEEECTELKDEVADFLSGFNYDTNSDISEPEGLDEIDDD